MPPLPMRAACAALLLVVVACSYDDTPMAMTIIDGETDRPLYARTLLQAAATPPQGEPSPEWLENIEFAWAQSQAAYAEVLRCVDDGVCRMGSLRAACDDVATLLGARTTLARWSEALAISELLSADHGPMNADRLALLRAEVSRDGHISPLEDSVLTLATSLALAHGVWALTPQGEKERLRRRQTHASDEFRQRCKAEAL